MDDNNSANILGSLEELSRFLRTHGVRFNHASLQKLLSRIEASVAAYHREARSTLSFGKMSMALRALFMLCDSKDPPLALIRARFSELPKPALDAILYRYKSRPFALVDHKTGALSSHVGQIGEDGTTADKLGRNETEDASSESETLDGKKTATSANVIAISKLKEWVATAPGDQILRYLPRLISDGGALLAGQRRGRNKISMPYFEPQILGRIARLKPMPILGQARARRDNPGGRPPKMAEDNLIMNLALDWLMATDEMPKSSQTKSNSFFQLVLKVFGEAKAPRPAGCELCCLVPRADHGRPRAAQKGQEPSRQADC